MAALAGAEFQVPARVAGAEDSARLPAAPAVRPGGLRADEHGDFRLEVISDARPAAHRPRHFRGMTGVTAASGVTVYWKLSRWGCAGEAG
ncbi:hypothetical protein [Streptomyces sp. H27-S2]|uniref:hypothetical protein n=1 Tax=Streptomyces antarcticus TaxID=2996458 RepID=UPI00226DEE4C|nr:hypothetical protein [Streptomyces sp. H27-S2]MCY0953392.1 hypothetical protein [Streptomyces sp. H27-S2]